MAHIEPTEPNPDDLAYLSFLNRNLLTGVQTRLTRLFIVNLVLLVYLVYFTRMLAKPTITSADYSIIRAPARL